jgi:hypothetical protein
MKEHKNKHIREAVDYALGKGWRLEMAGAHAHAWGYLLCPERSRDGHRISVFSTPRCPEHHAESIRRAIDACEHGRHDQ